MKKISCWNNLNPETCLQKYKLNNHFHSTEIYNEYEYKLIILKVILLTSNGDAKIHHTLTSLARDKSILPLSE